MPLRVGPATEVPLALIDSSGRALWRPLGGSDSATRLVEAGSSNSDAIGMAASRGSS